MLNKCFELLLLFACAPVCLFLLLFVLLLLQEDKQQQQQQNPANAAFFIIFLLPHSKLWKDLFLSANLSLSFISNKCWLMHFNSLHLYLDKKKTFLSFSLLTFVFILQMWHRWFCNRHFRLDDKFLCVENLEKKSSHFCILWLIFWCCSFALLYCH